ncbi:cytochrome-c oxidase [Bacillus pfraonensis]|uniref:cytochrome-c oxidase n=1 Tax=Bacillus TaxID=1386 RepID=UPI0015748AE7|nr:MULTISPECIES: cytochrome-c oxidase [unclassified Bacillus (in: firmicutes)]MBC6973600.1 cytochrome-c oxidase [Bacillus sp. Xin]NSW37003.1 cytochrome-c oxidase [Bacillus sp. Xin1]HEK9101590.1 cytochrome-c oxidase [Bacillus pseudomycoides]
MGIRFIQISSIYFVIGVCMGLFMSISSNFKLTAVHVHVLLLGWTSMMIAGILYYIFKEAGTSKLGKLHFWLLNIGLPIMMIALAFEIYGYHAAIPFVAGGSILVVLSIIIFTINIFVHIKENNSIL